MEITRKAFWTEAMKGGTIIGLVIVAFELLLFSAGTGRWLYFVELVAFAMLLYAFTRKISAKPSARDGFPYSRCIGFVMAMMLFTGVVSGVYLSVMNNFVNPEGVVAIVDAVMVSFQDAFPQEQFDALYDMMYASYRNPLYLVIASVIAYVVQGGIIGLFTSALAQRKPNPFAPEVGHNDDNVKVGDGE